MARGPGPFQRTASAAPPRAAGRGTTPEAEIAQRDSARNGAPRRTRRPERSRRQGQGSPRRQQQGDPC
eukprot:11209773-Alexandrium_andersonii.AAC.1